jgi:hypothetical protein
MAGLVEQTWISLIFKNVPACYLGAGVQVVRVGGADLDLPDPGDSLTGTPRHIPSA